MAYAAVAGIGQIDASRRRGRHRDQDIFGIELIGRCDKRIEIKTAYVMPTRQQVEDQLFQSQIAALARRYLRDLKRDANIQVRDDSKPDALIR